MTAPTVSAAIERLIDEDLVESRFGSSNGGRRPNMLRFNASYAHVLAVDLGGTVLRVALADMNGTMLGKWSAPSRSASSPEQVIAMIRTGMEHLTRQAGLSMEAVKVVAAGNPGITDVDAGVVVSAPNLKNWRNVPFRNLLESTLGIAAVVENDVNLAAIGETLARGGARSLEFCFSGARHRHWSGHLSEWPDHSRCRLGRGRGWIYARSGYARHRFCTG